MAGIGEGNARCLSIGSRATHAGTRPRLFIYFCLEDDGLVKIMRTLFREEM
jgi:hypothetical protein